MRRNRATASGEYQFCFDNSFSHITTKIVFFRLTVREDMNDDTAFLDGIAESQELLPFEITVDNFKVFKSYFCGDT